MKHTKRIAALLLALALCFSCAACSKTVGSYRVVKTLGTEQFRIGFRDGDQAAVYVNAALKVLAADGTIHSLALKWFGTDNTTFDSDANALDALGDIAAHVHHGPERGALSHELRRRRRLQRL